MVAVGGTHRVHVWGPHGVAVGWSGLAVGLWGVVGPGGAGLVVWAGRVGGVGGLVRIHLQRSTVPSPLGERLGISALRRSRANPGLERSRPGAGGM